MRSRMSDLTAAKRACVAARRVRRRRLVVALAALLSIPGTAPVEAGDGAMIEKMLRIADASRHPIDEGVVHVRATVEEPGKAPAVSLLDVFVQGRDRVLAVFRAGSLEGRRVLMVEQKVWLLIPDVARAIPISANQRLLGGVAIYDIARLSFASEYDASLREEDDMVGDVPCHVLELTARSRKTSYAGGELWIGMDDGLPRQAEFTLRSGKPAKLVRFEDYDLESGRPRLTRMRIVHLLPSERGLETTLEFIGYEGRTLAPDMFDPARARDAP